MSKDNRMQTGILGDINPKPGTEDHVTSKKDSVGGRHEETQSMVGGTRNLRQGTGHTGGDIGNRPE